LYHSAGTPQTRRSVQWGQQSGHALERYDLGLRGIFPLAVTPRPQNGQQARACASQTVTSGNSSEGLDAKPLASNSPTLSSCDGWRTSSELQRATCCTDRVSQTATSRRGCVGWGNTWMDYLRNTLYSAHQHTRALSISDKNLPCLCHPRIGAELPCHRDLETLENIL
jgi:hypothetical protein